MTMSSSLNFLDDVNDVKLACAVTIFTECLRRLLLYIYRFPCLFGVRSFALLEIGLITPHTIRTIIAGLLIALSCNKRQN